MDEAAAAPLAADFEDLFEEAPCGFLCVSPNWKILRANATFGRWTGHDPGALVGTPFVDLLDIAGRIYVGTHFMPMLRLQQRFDEVALNVLRAEGGKMPVLVNASERRGEGGETRMILVSVFNATDRRRYEADLLGARDALREANDTLERRVEQAVAERMAAESALAHARRMEAIGNLSAGVAHDFNNLLQVIGGSLQLLRKYVAPAGQERIQTAMGGVERGAKLADQLLAFGRQQVLDAKVHDLSGLVAASTQTLLGTIGREVDLRVEDRTRDGRPARARIDAAQFENALLNLSVNARDAMREMARAEGRALADGVLTVGLDRVVLDVGRAGTAAGRVPAGDHVAVSVRDTGPGMTPEVALHAFDPFFTTKPTGEGTGLGLSMVYGFATQAGGHVSIDAAPGEGTTVTLWLPATDAPLAGEEAARALTVPTGTETLLVVEDDDPVRAVTCALLRDLGYEVLETRDGTEALTVLGAGQRVHVMITDIVMPGPMRGSTLAREASRRHPDLRIVFVTGYADAAARLELAGRGEPLLRKPFTAGRLAKILRDVLSDGPGLAEPRAAERLPEAPPAEVVSEAEATTSPPRGPCVLLVEDEPLIRMAAAEMLSDLGCEVVEAESAETALERIGPGRFDLLITDVNLGGTSGIELAREAARIDPRLRIAFATGTRDAPEIPGVQADLLGKPFTDEALSRVVFGMIDPVRA